MMCVENMQMVSVSRRNCLILVQFQKIIFVDYQTEVLISFPVSGKTVEEYQKSLSIKAGISGSYGLFSGSVQASFSLN